jgi:AcrR family transcriptional regulator
MPTMPRKYGARVRAASMARTRARILRTARKLLLEATDVPVDTIAERAGVSVQTLYTHFGSKRGLLLAVFDASMGEAGTYVDFERVWESPDGETALRRMLEATFRIWHELWDIVAFSERARRTDPEIRRYLQEVDGFRRSNLCSITDRLAIEGRLHGELDAGQAADLAFALSIPPVYEELVRIRGWTLARAAESMVESVVAAIIDASTKATTDPPADWSSVLQPPDAMGTAGDPGAR